MLPAAAYSEKSPLQEENQDQRHRRVSPKLGHPMGTSRSALSTGGTKTARIRLHTFTSPWNAGRCQGRLNSVINSCLASARCSELTAECSRLSGPPPLSISAAQWRNARRSTIELALLNKTLHTVRMHHNVFALELMFLRPV